MLGIEAVQRLERLENYVRGMLRVLQMDSHSVLAINDLIRGIDGNLAKPLGPIQVFDKLDGDGESSGD